MLFSKVNISLYKSFNKNIIVKKSKRFSVLKNKYNLFIDDKILKRYSIKKNDTNTTFANWAKVTSKFYYDSLI